MLEKSYELTKVASGSLSLLKKEDFKTTDYNNKFVIDLFEFFLILLTNDFDKFKRETMILDITEKILPKMKIDSISKKYTLMLYS